jgi:hypothetical protein
MGNNKSKVPPAIPVPQNYYFLDTPPDYEHFRKQCMASLGFFQKRKFKKLETEQQIAFVYLFKDYDKLFKF